MTEPPWTPPTTACSDLLEADARTSVTALAARLENSPAPPCRDRIARLERSGESEATRSGAAARAGRRRLIRAHVMLSVDPKAAERVVADLRALPG